MWCLGEGLEVTGQDCLAVGWCVNIGHSLSLSDGQFLGFTKKWDEGFKYEVERGNIA